MIEVHFVTTPGSPGMVIDSDWTWNAQVVMCTSTVTRAKLTIPWTSIQYIREMAK